MTRIGVIGSGEYTNKDFLIETLEREILKDKDIIVSGHSPRRKYKNIDIWAEEWAKEYCFFPPLIYPPKEFTREEFFTRNELIAEASQKLICFINSGQYISGTWNTIKHFIKKNVIYGKDWIIFNEFGILWDIKDLPKWVKI